MAKRGKEVEGGGGRLYLLTGPRPYLVVVIVGVSDGSMISMLANKIWPEPGWRPIRGLLTRSPGTARRSA